MNRRQVRPREKGAALLAVLLLVAVTGAIAAAAMEKLRLSRAVAMNAVAIDQARAYAHGIEQIAILVFASRSNHPTLGGGKVLLISDLMRQIMEDLGDQKLNSNLVPEHHTILRTLQFVIEYRKKVFDTLR